MGSLRGGWLFRLSRGGVFGGRRAIILKSHGLDLLQEKEEQRDPGEVAAGLLSPWDVVPTVSPQWSLPESLIHSGNTRVY